MTPPPVPRTAPGRGPRRIAPTIGLAALVLASVAVTGAGAAPPPQAKAGGRTGHTTTTTTTAPSSDAGSAGSESEAFEPVPLRRAALRLVVQTTSGYARVDLPGVSAGHVVVDAHGRDAAGVLPTSQGVAVYGTAGTYGSVTVDVVTELPETAQDAAITLRQGAAGATYAYVQNRTTEVRNVAAMSTDGASPTATRTVPADELMGPDQLRWDMATDERKVLAFAYPWFDERATTDPQLSVHPTDPWEHMSADEARRSTELARAHGIDGFVLSFLGAAKHGLVLSHALDAAAETGGTASVLIEAVIAGDLATTEQWIREALDQADHPGFLRHEGVPTIFIFGGYRFSNAEWRAMVRRLEADGRPVRIIGDIWDGQGGAMTGGYRYNALLQAPTDPMTPTELTNWNRSAARELRARATLGHGDPGLVVATVQPGWDDRPLRGDDRLVVPWNGTRTYDDTWRAALAGEPDWVAITSWNEWYEGTGVAPSQEHGAAALEATSTWAQQFS